jgi:hypothetical protein
MTSPRSGTRLSGRAKQGYDDYWADRTILVKPAEWSEHEWWLYIYGWLRDGKVW